MEESKQTGDSMGGEPSKQMRSLLQRAEQGDATALPAIRCLLDTNAAIWGQYGDLSLQAEASLVLLASGNNLLLSESLLRKVEALKAELTGPCPDPLTRLLVERVAGCWLQTFYLDALVAQTIKASTKQADELRRRQDGAQRRYLSAIKALDTMRRHLKPAPINGTPARHTPVHASLPEAIASRLGRLGKQMAGATATN